MNAIRMQHPLHGFTNAYDQSDINRLKSHGWSVEDEKPARVVGVDLDGNGTIDKVFEAKKPGRPKKV